VVSFLLGNERDDRQEATDHGQSQSKSAFYLSNVIANFLKGKQRDRCGIALYF